MVDMDGENTRKWINIDQIDRIRHQQNISYPSQQAGQGAQAAAWWSTGWWQTRPQIDFNFGFFSSNCRDQNPPWRHHYIMSSCCLPKMWNFSKVSIHQCFPFTSISFIFQYIVKILDLQPHLVWTFCHWILPVNFLNLNMSSEKHPHQGFTAAFYHQLKSSSVNHQGRSKEQRHVRPALADWIVNIVGRRLLPDSPRECSPKGRRYPRRSCSPYFGFWNLDQAEKLSCCKKRFLGRIVLKFPEPIVLNWYLTAMALSSKSETCGAHLRKLEERLKFNSFWNTKGVLALVFPLGLGTWVSPSPSSREWSEFLKGISLQTQKQHPTGCQ